MNVDEALSWGDNVEPVADYISPEDRALVVLAAEVRRLQAREAKARELAIRTVDETGYELRDDWSRWLAEGSDHGT